MIRATVAPLLVALSPLVLHELGRAAVDVGGLERCAPDWIAVGATFAALRATPTSACLWAATAGLLEDVPAGTPFGLGGARVAFLVAALSGLRSLDLGSPLLRPLAAFGLAFADKVLLAFTLAATGEGTEVAPLVAHAFLIALATAVVTPLVWPAAELLTGMPRPRWESA